ncbi:glycosyl transferase [Asanoa siamensis]|uniref:Glycosyl transferase n=1 Tax=Asanoa siamensis TaxID=926357 RepID=A0ABQ4CGS4_9ACTN|nr:glycosyl transferase [Asanoa siamensis]
MTGRFWVDLGQATPAVNPQDHVFFQWVLAHGAQVAEHGIYPFTTKALNMPDGVNLMANTSVLGLGIPTSWMTLLWGPQTTFAFLLVIGLAGTAFGWYWVFSRHLVDNRLVAFAAGALCGFAPGLISHAQGHINWTAQFVVPWLVVATIKLARPGHAIKRGIWLGLLVTYQAFVNEEVLLYTALGLLIFVLAYTLAKPKAIKTQIPSFLGGLAVAVVLAALLLGYPLWVQFFGPQSYQGVPTAVKDVSTDLAAYPAFARLSIAGSTAGAENLTQGPAEENSFLGWPLLIMCLIAVGLTWRRKVTWALLVTGLVFVALSLGPNITVNRDDTGVDGPWRWLENLPIFNSVVPTRLSLIVVPVAAALLALGADQILTFARSRRPPTAIALRVVTAAAILGALVPLAPRQIPTTDVPETPAFVTQGLWRDYASDGRSLVFVPVTDNIYLDGMRWAAQAQIGFAIAGGYFLGPATEGDDNRAIFNAPTRFTGALFDQTARSGDLPPVTDETRAKFQDDLAFWRADALVLPQTETNAGQLRFLVTELTGEIPDDVGGAWVWRVR